MENAAVVKGAVQESVGVHGPSWNAPAEKVWRLLQEHAGPRDPAALPAKITPSFFFYLSLSATFLSDLLHQNINQPAALI